VPVYLHLHAFCPDWAPPPCAPSLPKNTDISISISIASDKAFPTSYPCPGPCHSCNLPSSAHPQGRSTGRPTDSSKKPRMTNDFSWLLIPKPAGLGYFLLTSLLNYYCLGPSFTSQPYPFCCQPCLFRPARNKVGS